MPPCPGTTRLQGLGDSSCGGRRLKELWTKGKIKVSKTLQIIPIIYKARHVFVQQQKRVSWQRSACDLDSAAAVICASISAPSRPSRCHSRDDVQAWWFGEPCPAACPNTMAAAWAACSLTASSGELQGDVQP